MNSRDIILANLNHDNPARPGMTFDRGRVNDMLIIPLLGHADNSKQRWVDGNQEFYHDEWGNLWVRLIGGSVKGEIYKPFIEDWSRLDSLQVPDYKNPSRYTVMKDKFAACDDKFKVAQIGGWIFDNARYLRKLDNYFMDMVMHPDKLKKLHSIIGEVYEAKIQGAGRAGADAVFIGEDMGTQNGLLFSPDMFRTYFKEDYARLIEIAHGYGMKVLLHSCGKNWDILDDLMDVGIDCFQFDQPAVYDMPALAEKFKKKKVALWSPVDIQKVMPTGDKAYIEEQTQLMLETFHGFLITKNYPDLKGIGVKEEWDDWAYNKILEFSH